jgi:hypothetical protein
VVSKTRIAARAGKGFIEHEGLPLKLEKRILTRRIFFNPYGCYPIIAINAPYFIPEGRGAGLGAVMDREGKKL